VSSGAVPKSASERLCAYVGVSVTLLSTRLFEACRKRLFGLGEHEAFPSAAGSAALGGELGRIELPAWPRESA